MIISAVHLEKSMHKLKKNVAVSGFFHTKKALRAEFAAFNRKWNRGWVMRIVQIAGGGYAGVLRRVR